MRRSSIVLLAFALSACGGGGVGNQSSVVPAPTSATSVSNGGVPAVSLPQMYSVVDLGASFVPAAINNNNGVTGTIGNGPNYRAFIYQSGKITTFQVGTIAVAINDSNVAVGQGSIYSPNGTIVKLGTANSMVGSRAEGIDDSGRVVGVSILGGVIASCGGSLTLFSASGIPTITNSQTNTLAVSHNGNIVADGAPNVGACLAEISPFYYPSLKPVPLPNDLTLIAEGSAVTGINDAGDVVGYSQKTGTTETVTFYAHAGTAEEIDPPAGYDSFGGLAINASDWIVGYGLKSGTLNALVWNRGTITNLNTLLAASCSQWTLNEATGVNDAGDITGVGTLNGTQHGVLLVPLN